MILNDDSQPSKRRQAGAIGPDSPAGRLITAIYGPGHLALQDGRMTRITATGTTEPAPGAGHVDAEDDTGAVLDDWLDAAQKAYDNAPPSHVHEANDQSPITQPAAPLDRGRTITAILERARKRAGHHQDGKR